MPFEWPKFGHVVTIIFSIGLAEGTILPTLLAARRRDVLGIRAGIAMGEVGEKLANPFLIVSIVFGVGAALTGQIDLTAPWLVTTYLILLAMFALVALGGFRHFERIKEAAAASPVDAPSSKLVRLLDSRWTLALSFLPPLAMAAIVYLMVVKPMLW